mmetsp:Transcript_8602/g.10143  ORF Transcript_8602/g.10143 Transcript_8602/m.10143 type:complete len:311 (-) Transcript_8602:509-1441(-)|eukprot:CAMPEP_0204826444 /NCGR_PEP_ID=MMETSP1346-20131115/4135_1 /ASSEMBLY_ACC=CAM_ASM_000771 /TAXON_ID=215587 /ORGANISM="Aplanochytrium stocchinoi, Strain GSBS06" /LENGTH=310 /DNA_ID=CAMNT_0051954477 /DNA_START=206 /DNA_END=1141 /DNA_ORIENTATION=+
MTAAASSLDQELLAAAKEGAVDDLAFLIEDGANVNYKDRFGMSPLLWAATNGHSSCVECLLENGANLEIQAENGDTPLLFAADQGRFKVVKLLVEAGANMEAKTKFGNTALILAAWNGKLKTTKYLTYAGANVHHKNKKQETAVDKAENQQIREAIQKAAQRVIKDASVDLRNSFGVVNAQKGDSEVVDWLLDHDFERIANRAVYHGMITFELTRKCDEEELFQALEVKKLSDKMMIRESPLRNHNENVDIGNTTAALDSTRLTDQVGANDMVFSSNSGWNSANLKDTFQDDEYGYEVGSSDYDSQFSDD